MKAARPLCIGVAGVLLAAGVVAALVPGLADVHYTRARLLLGPAAEEQKALPLPTLLAAQAAMREALDLDASNPHYVEQFARTQELKARALVPADPAARQALRQAAAAVRLAARQRPGFPYAWASLARIKLRQGDLDFEFYGALERANRLGPWERAVQLTTVDIGMSAWPLLPAQAKGWVLGALDRALLRDEPSVQWIARGHGTMAAICEAARRPARVTAFCVRK